MFMKPVILFLSLYATGVKAQNILQFNKKTVECENKWVAFPVNGDNQYCFGFVYINAETGLMFDYQGSFKIKGHNFSLGKIDSSDTQYSLQQNEAKVAIIPAAKFKELNITAFPRWLQARQADTGSIKRLLKWGSLYNSWGESNKAIAFLERAKKIDTAYPELDYELAFAYNGANQYDKAISLLENSIITDPENCYLYKELAFAQMHLGLLEKAAATCKKGIALCPDKGIKSDIAYNITYQYYKVRNKEEFKSWAEETKKWITTGSEYINFLNGMEADMEKQLEFSR